MRTRWLFLILPALALLGMGANPRYLESLRIGGGYGDADDGGLDIEANGDLNTDGEITAGMLTLDTPLADASVADDITIIETDTLDTVTGRGASTANGITVGTVDTGQGANELYGMDQDVLTTSNVTFEQAALANALVGGGYGSTGINLEGTGNIEADGNGTFGGLLRSLERIRGAGVSADGLLLHWRMDSISSVADYSGNADTFSISNAPTGGLVPSKFGDGWDNDGSDIDNTSGPNVTAQPACTLSMWVRLDNAAESDFMGYYIYTSGADNLFLGTHGSGVAYARTAISGSATNLYGSSDLRDGAWHHICAVFDGTSGFRIYADGVLENSSPVSVGASDFAGHIRLYCRADGGVDEIAIWDRALAAEELAALAMAGRELNAPASPSLLKQDGATDGQVMTWDMANGWQPESPTVGTVTKRTIEVYGGAAPASSATLGGLAMDNQGMASSNFTLTLPFGIPSDYDGEAVTFSVYWSLNSESMSDGESYSLRRSVDVFADGDSSSVSTSYTDLAEIGQQAGVVTPAVDEVNVDTFTWTGGSDAGKLAALALVMDDTGTTPDVEITIHAVMAEYSVD